MGDRCRIGSGCVKRTTDMHTCTYCDLQIIDQVTLAARVLLDAREDKIECKDLAELGFIHVVSIAMNGTRSYQHHWLVMIIAR